MVKRAQEAEAKRLAEEAAAVQREAEIESICDDIDAAMEPYLREHLAAVNSQARISRAVKKDFEKFKTYCSTKWSTPPPHLPAKPQAVAAFLVHERNHGVAQRLCRNISTVHRAVGFGDPTTDVLVQAVLRSIKTQPKGQIENGKE